MANTNEKLLAALKCVAAALGQNKTFPADIAYAKRVAAEAIKQAEDAPAQQAPPANQLENTFQNLLAFYEASGLTKTASAGVGPFRTEPVEYSVVTDAKAALAGLSGLFSQYDEMRKILEAIQEFFRDGETAHAGSLLFEDDYTLREHINFVLAGVPLEAHDREFSLDNWKTTSTLAEILQHNQFEADDLANLVAANVGDEVRFGGGAFALRTLKRVK